MKIIDLLNKIANEEIYTGTKVVYRDKEFIFTGSCLENIKEKSAIAMFALDNLNDEVEVIEESKTIKKLKNLNMTKVDIKNKGQVYGVTKEEMIADIKTLQFWVNKIIDKLNMID